MIVQVGRVDHSTRAQVSVINGSHRGRDASHRSIADRLLGKFHMSGLVAENRAHILAMAARVCNYLIVLHGQIFSLFPLEEVIHVRNRRGDLKDDENIGAEIKNLLRHVVVDPRNERDHSDHSRHPNHHSKQGQHRAQLIHP